MSNLENPLLLKEYSSLRGPYQLVLKENDQPNNISEYYLKLIDQFSHKKINSILEIYSEDSMQVSLRKAGYQVTSIVLDMQVNAVGGEKDGDHFIIGQDFNLPDFKQKFDAILITEGSFGKLVSEEKSVEFISCLTRCLNSSALILFEFLAFKKRPVFM